MLRATLNGHRVRHTFAVIVMGSSTDGEGHCVYWWQTRGRQEADEGQTKINACMGEPAMTTVEFSKDGSEHFTASLRDCLEDIQQRGEYLLYDGDLYWRPSTMLRVHTPQWLGFEGTVIWWPAGQRDPLEGGVAAVAVGRALMSQRFVVVEAKSLPAVYQHNVL